MARTPHWVRGVAETTSFANDALIMLDSQTVGWTLVRSIWQLQLYDQVGHAQTFYPGSLTTYGIIATQGNPAPDPLSPSINPDQDWLWYETVFFRRFDTSDQSPNFSLNYAPVDNGYRQSEGQRLGTDVEIAVWFICDQATFGGATFKVQLGYQFLWLEP